MESNLSSSVDDELEKLVSSNADVSSQYVIFSNISDEAYAINVAKVEGLLIYKELSIAKSSNQNSAVVGVSKIRDKMVTIVNFDKWIGKDSSDSDYELLMLCQYGGRDIGLLIQNVISIMSIDSDKLYDNANQDEKISYISEIDIKREKKLCLLFDGDKLLVDIFPDTIENRNFKREDKVKISKKILFADDSKIIQKIIKNFFDDMELNFEIFSNGKELLDRLEEININEVGVIITDIEMPVVDGLKVLSALRENPKTKEIPIIVNTNMASGVIKTKALELGATYVISKIDLKELYSSILAFSK
jgi:two-component system, chemotaxis family, chemotaxis protein CheV